MREEELTLASLAREVARLRIENARYRRYLEDLLTNLDEENMPTVSARLATLAAGLALLLTAGDGGQVINGDALIAALNAASGRLAGARLSLDGASAAATYTAAGTKTDTMRALCVDKDGTLHAVI